MCPVKTSTVTRLALPRSSPPVPPSAAQQGLMYTGSTTQRQWHVAVLRDLRRAQSEPLLPLLFWRSSHSDDWPLQLSASLAANSWSAARVRVRHVFLEALLLDCEVTLPGQFCLGRCCQSGNFLLRCNESRMVGLAVLILLLGGHQLL